jgi:hypothetical protein
LREHEDRLRRRGSEPSLSYIAVVSGDKSVSVVQGTRVIELTT